MELTALNRMIHLLNYYENEDEKSIDLIVKDNIDFIKNYVKPFELELEFNLVNKNNYSQRRDLVKHYIFKFWSFQGFHNHSLDTLYHKKKSDGSQALKSISEVKTSFEKYTILCFEYINIIFEIIQNFCFLYKIDFIETCKEVDFKLDSIIIDCGTTTYFNNATNTEIEEKFEAFRKKAEQIITETKLAQFVINKTNQTNFTNREIFNLAFGKMLISDLNKLTDEQIVSCIKDAVKVGTQKYNESDFIQNYESFVSLFNQFRFKCEAENFKLNESSISNFQNLLPLGKAVKLIQSAKEEIKPLALTQNNNIDNLRKKLNSDLTEMHDLINNIIDANTNEIIIENSKESLAFLEIKNVFQLFKDSISEHFELKSQHKEMKAETGIPKTTTEYLKDLEAAFNDNLDYQKAIELIDNFFSGVPVKINEPIFVKNGNIKNLAFALGEVWRSKKKNEVITYEYLEFYKKAFSIFDRQNIDRYHLFGCNLYKYSITRT